MKWKKCPLAVQGGMGIGVSLWPLARAVSLSDPSALGVVSGVALLDVFIRELQLGDIGGKYRQALKHFPGDRRFIRRILRTYLGKIGENGQFLSAPSTKGDQAEFRDKLKAVAAFCEVWLAKNGPNGKKVPIGFNLLTKVETDLLPELCGAILAGVDFVFMGAGIPTQIPAIITRLTDYQPVEYRLTVEGVLPGDHFVARFDPAVLGIRKRKPLKRPKFFAIVSSFILALKMQEAGADGIIVEFHTAGGHNAPPRRGNTYGEKDEIDWAKFRERITIPYLIAGSLASRSDRWQRAKEVGASGIQFGSIYALCEESKIRPDLKTEMIRLAFEGNLSIRKDFKFSSSGYPFEIAEKEGTLSEKDIFDSRKRKCDKYYLKTAYRKEGGTLGWRCPGGPISAYVAQGGNPENCIGTGCLCNALLVAVGLGDPGQLPVLTLGDDVSFVPMMIDHENGHYSAKQATKFLLQGSETLTN